MSYRRRKKEEREIERGNKRKGRGGGREGREEVSHKRSRTCNNSIYQKEIELQTQCGKIA